MKKVGIILSLEMVLAEKLLLIALVSLLKNQMTGSDSVDSNLASSLSSIGDKAKIMEKHMEEYKECISNLSGLMSNVMNVGVDMDYDKSVEATTNCITSMKGYYDEITGSIQSLAEKYHDSLQDDIPAMTATVTIPETSTSFSLDVLNDKPILKGVHTLEFLHKLREIYKKTKSTALISLKKNLLQLTMKEGYIVTVTTDIDEEYHYKLISATIEPPYPCFQEAIAYSIQRNDIQLLAHQTIYALYAHKRLHSEIEELAPKAIITTEDDVHLTMTFDNHHVVKVTIPAIYPNTFGMIQIDSVESPKKEKLEPALKAAFYGGLTEAVEGIYNILQNM